MSATRAFIGGVAGAMAMTMASLVLAQLGIHVGLEQLVAVLLGFAPGASLARGAGFLVHLLIGGWLGILYAYGFERLTCRAGWGVGAAFGMAHLIIAGFGLGVIGLGLRAAHLSSVAPALFDANQGLSGVCSFMLLHLLYGSVVGSLYAFTGTPDYIRVKGLGG